MAGSFLPTFLYLRLSVAMKQQTPSEVMPSPEDINIMNARRREMATAAWTSVFITVEVDEEEMFQFSNPDVDS